MEFIVKNRDEVFGEKQERKWLKAYLLYILKDWSTIFSGLNMEHLGEITRISFVTGNESFADFYIYQWEPGLILMFTSSTKEEYEKTLKQFILSTKGITESWIRPTILEQMKAFLIEKYDAKVYRFIGRRYRHWKYPAQLRPNYNRRHSYSGEDANETLKEMQHLYGIIPSSIDIRIDDWKMQINRNGLFIIRYINRKSLGILQEIVERIVAEQMRIRTTSEKFNIQTRNLTAGTKEIKIPGIIAGKITLPNTTLSETIVQRIFHPSEFYDMGDSEGDNEEMEEKFSFIDTYVSEGPLIFTATVVDEDKGTVFGLSGTDNEIAIIPKHRITFESFIKFYNLITLYFDDEAKLALFGEELIA